MFVKKFLIKYWPIKYIISKVSKINLVHITYKNNKLTLKKKWVSAYQSAALIQSFLLLICSIIGSITNKKKYPQW